jgi:hypothetical protein
MFNNDMQQYPTIKVYLLSHIDGDNFKNKSANLIEKINLNTLELPIENTNDLAENRIFLANDNCFCPNSNYLGVLSSRYEEKYPNLIRLNNLSLIKKKIEPNKVLVAAPTKEFNQGKWIEWSEYYHGPIRKYLDELASIMGLPLVNNESFWANNFICHRSIFFDFLKVFKKTFLEMHKRHGYLMNFKTDDPSRASAYLYERVSMIYFSNRTDLIIEKLPTINNFNFDKIRWIASAASNYQPLTNIWHDSLKNLGIKDENILFNTIDAPTNMNDIPKFRTEIWYFCIKKIIQLILDELNKHKTKSKYDYFIVCDCDIQFFSDRDIIWKTLFDYVDSTNFDFYFQPEDDVNICAGFYIIKKQNIEKAIVFLQKVNQKITHSKNEDMPFADQTIIKSMINEISACILPPAVCIQGPRFNPKYKDVYLFHHAINAFDMPMKLTQMQQIQNLMLN